MAEAFEAAGLPANARRSLRVFLAFLVGRQARSFLPHLAPLRRGERDGAVVERGKLRTMADADDGRVRELSFLGRHSEHYQGT